MLGKLLKYELMGTARYFLPLFAAALLFSILNRLFNSVFSPNFYWINGLLMFIEVILIIAIAVMMLVIIILRFYKNLLGNEGYLMFTLPVSTHHNILSKLITATIWNVAAMLVVAASIFIIAGANVNDVALNAWNEFIRFAVMTLNLDPILLMFEWIVLCLVSVVGNILMLYLAMAIGQLANEHKFLVSFGAFIGIQIGLSIIVSAVGSAISGLAITTGPEAFEWFDSLGIARAVQLGTLAAAFISIALGAACYFVTHFLLKRKLNLS